MAGHETDDVVELAVALNRAKHITQRLLVGLGNFETEFLFEDVLGLGVTPSLSLERRNSRTGP